MSEVWKGLGHHRKLVVIWQTGHRFPVMDKVTGYHGKTVATSGALIGIMLSVSSVNIFLAPHTA